MSLLQPTETIEIMKQKAALRALECVRPGMKLGLGTGSTSENENSAFRFALNVPICPSELVAAAHSDAKEAWRPPNRAATRAAGSSTALRHGMAHNPTR